MSTTFVLFRNCPNELHSTDLRKKLHKIVQITFHFLSRGATSAVIQGDSAPWQCNLMSWLLRTGEGHHLLLFLPSALKTPLGLEPSLNYL